jgi:Putative restriction endonuclease
MAMLNPTKKIIYPISDGKPMADGDKQWKWIVRIKLGFEAVYKEEETYITGDTFWYPVEGKPKIVQAPDTMIAIGRPKGDRDCYFQWEEGDIAPQIVFEIWSPNNFQPEMDKKRAWYERYGVEEYYEFDPFRVRLMGWYKKDGKFEKIAKMDGWVSPLSKVRFEFHPQDPDNELKLFEPDGTPFKQHHELIEENQALAGQNRQLAIQNTRLQTERAAAEKRALESEQKLQALLVQLKAQGFDLPEK